MSMVTTDTRERDTHRPGPGTTTTFGQAELTLLMRNKRALAITLVLPVLMTFSFKAAADQMDGSATGMNVATALLPGAIGLVLCFVVCNNLTTAFVARCEEAGPRAAAYRRAERQRDPARDGERSC